MVDKPCVQHHIRPICDINAAMDTHPAVSSSEGAKGPCAEPFVFIPRYPDIRHGPCSLDDDNGPSLSVFLFLVGQFIFFFTIHKIVAIVVNRSGTLRSCLFDADSPYLYRSLLYLSYSTIRRVVVATEAIGPHIIHHVVRVLAIIGGRSDHDHLSPWLYDTSQTLSLGGTLFSNPYIIPIS